MGARNVIGLLAIAVFTSSCSHTLEVKNLDIYKPAFVNTQATGTKLGLSASTSSPEEERFITSFANALKRDGFRVTYPFFPNETNLRTVDYLVKINTASAYRGSGWNFLINWPGFLIWTPAWHGYNYGAEYDFDIEIIDTETNTSLTNIDSPVDLHIRHADMGRTWTEISWLEWSAIAFIGGILFTRYDHDITPQLVDAVEGRIGDYVAGKVGITLAALATDHDQPQAAAAPVETALAAE
jgi:hypothetical protein